MEIQFLGTSSGVPSKHRNVTAIAVKRAQGKRWFLVDCGEATQHQLLHSQLSLSKLAAIFITHVHGDHCFGLPGLLASAAMNGRKQTLPIVAPAALEALINLSIDATQMRPAYPIQFIAIEALDKLLEFADVAVEIKTLSHRVPSYAYCFTETSVSSAIDQDKLRAHGITPGPHWGRLQKGENVTLDNGQALIAKDYLLSPRKAKKIIVAGDNDTPELLLDACRDADVLVHEATYIAETAQQIAFDPGHSTAQQVAKFAAACHLPNLILTHFSPRYGYDSAHSPSIADVEREARQHYHGNLFLANDFDQFRLENDGNLKLVGFRADRAHNSNL